MTNLATDIKQSGRVFGLDLMRAFAILGVVYHHFRERFADSFYPTIPFFNGFVGVEIFFVLSGFLIGGILFRSVQNGRFGRFNDLLRFWKRRWFRTLPNYFLFLVVFYLMQEPIITTSLLSYLIFCQNLLWPIHDFYEVSWSLAVEEWFYLLFPGLFFFLYFRGAPWQKAFWWTFIGLISFSTFLSISTPLQTTWADFEDWQRKIALVRLSGIMMGVLMAYFKETRSPLWALMLKYRFLVPVPLLFFFGINFSAIVHVNLLFSYKFFQVILFPLFTFCCALFLPMMDSLRQGPRGVSGVIEYISRISYSLYLCHFAAMAIVDRNLMQVPVGQATQTRHEAMILYCVIAFLMAHLVHRFWELPWMNRRESRAI